ncbi:MAG: outer membrane beta-barrel protein [Bernardetiaceae bacterium]|nr:outer membrane beta-barrel protein [Bernardetiaceae bacterium]
MINHGDSFEDRFKDAFKDAELEPRPRVWQGIASKLDQVPAHPPKVVPMVTNQAGSSRNWFGRYAAAAALLLGLGLAAYFYLTPSETSQIVQQPSIQTLPSDIDQTNTHSDSQSLPGQPAEATKSIDNQVSSNEQNPTANSNDGQNTEANESVARPLGQAQVDVRTGGKTKAAVPNGLQLNKGYSNGNADGMNSGTKPTKSIIDHNANLLLNNPVGLAPQFQTNLLLGSELQQLAVAEPLAQLAAPLVTVNVPTVEKVEVGPQWWFTASGSYFNYTPGFSNVSTQMPSPFVSSVRPSIRDYDSVAVAPYLDALPQSRRSFGINAEVGKALGRNWGISSGLVFTHQNYTYDAPARIIRAQGTVGDRLMFSNQLNAQSTHVGLPLKAWYQTNGQGLNLRVSAGLLTDFTLGQRLSNTYGEVAYFLGDYRALNFSAVGSAGLLYNLGPRWGLYADVQYRRALGSVYDTPHLRATPTWLGGSLGVQYRW